MAKKGMVELKLDIEASGKASEQAIDVQLQTETFDCAPSCPGASYQRHASCCQTMSTLMVTVVFISTGTTYSRLMA